MQILKKLFGLMLTTATLVAAVPALASEEAPDVLIKRVSTELLEVAKTDSEIKKGNMERILELVEQKVFPHVDFQRMTQIAAGRFWREATPEQKKQLTDEFRDLLVYTYSGAISQVKDEKIEYKPSRFSPTDTDVEVRTQVIRSRGEPVPLSYRLEKTPGGWKIYDVNVLGAWLVETYKGNFSSEISKGGIDGLIKSLSEKNKRLAASAAKSAKRS